MDKQAHDTKRDSRARRMAKATGAFLLLLASRLWAGLVRGWRELGRRDAADLDRSTKVSLNLYRKEAATPDLVDGWACGPREIELAACGAFFLREPRGESDQLFPMLPTFTEPAEVGDLARWWVAHPDERDTAARKAREAVAARTFRANAAELLQLCGF